MLPRGLNDSRPITPLTNSQIKLGIGTAAATLPELTAHA